MYKKSLFLFAIILLISLNFTNQAHAFKWKNIGDSFEKIGDYLTPNIDIDINNGHSSNNGSSSNRPSPKWVQTFTQYVNANSLLQFYVLAKDQNAVCTQTTSNPCSIGGNFRYSVSNLPYGAYFNPSTRQFSWTPNSNQLGTYNVIFRISDGSTYLDMSVPVVVGCNGNCNTYFSQIIWNQISTQYVTVNNSIQFYVSANNVNGGPISYSALSLPSGAYFDPNTRQFSWVPNSSQAGSFTVVFRASDGINSLDMNVLIIVNGSNNGCGTNCNQNSSVPVWSQVSAQSGYTGDVIQFTVFATSPSNNNLSYVVYGLPYGASFDSNSHIFNWNVGNSQAGNYSITFRAYDGSLYSDLRVPITIIYRNNNNYNYNYPNAPYYNPPPYYSGPYSGSNYQPRWVQILTQTGYVGQILRFNVLASDPENNNLSYSAFSLPSGATFDTNTRTFSWTPTSGDVGSHNIVFRVTDGYSAAQDMNVNVVILNGGQATPSFTNFNPPSTAIENQTWSYTVSAISNSGYPVTYRLIDGPDGLTMNPTTGTMFWVPNSNQGRISPYPVSVGAYAGGPELTGTFYITVQDVNGNNYFYSAPEAQIKTPTGSSRPIISNLEIKKFDNGVVVSWQTNIASKSRVIYGPDSEINKSGNYSYPNATEYSSLAKDNLFNISGLEKDKTYYFRAVSVANSITSVSEEISYIYLADNGQGLGFALGSFGQLISNGWFIVLALSGLGFFFYPKLVGKRS